MSESLSDAVHAFVWRDEAAIPGRHPERVSDPATLAQVQRIVAELDAIRPGTDSRDLMEWAEREVRTLAARHPDLNERAIRALRDLLSWTWR